MLESGVVDLRPLITHQYPLEEMETALQLLKAGEACKIVLLPDGEGPKSKVQSPKSEDAGAAGIPTPNAQGPTPDAGTPEHPNTRTPEHPTPPKWSHR